MVEDEFYDDVWEEAERRADDRLLDILAGRAPASRAHAPSLPQLPMATPEGADLDAERQEAQRHAEQIRQQEERVRDFTRRRLENGELEDQEIEIEVEESSLQTMQVFSGAGLEEMGFNMQDMLGNLFPAKRVTKKTTVAEARRIMSYQEAEKLVDQHEVAREALERVEENGIVFLDELDKIAHREGGHGPDVSREGVQRDILPIIEGSTVMTKYGPVDTSHMLFIAAGAFHVSKPSDLIPELQGRFPIRVELQSLSEEDFRRILVEPQNALVRQYTELLATEDIRLEFTPEALHEVARLAKVVNDNTENIGARRLYTMMERLLDELSFEAPDVAPQRVVVDAKYVADKMGNVVEDRNLSRYML